MEGFAIKSTYGFGYEFHFIEELYYIFVFSKLHTPDIKRHVGEDHSNSIQPYHSSQQLRFGSCFRYPQVSSLRCEHFSQQTQNLGRAPSCD